MQLFTGYTANSQNNQHPFIFVVWDIQFHIHTATKSPPQSLLSRIIYSELSQELSVPKVWPQELSVPKHSQELSIPNSLKSYLSQNILRSYPSLIFTLKNYLSSAFSRVIYPKHQELFVPNILRSYLSKTSRVICPKHSQELSFPSIFAQEFSIPHYSHC